MFAAAAATAEAVAPAVADTVVVLEEVLKVVEPADPLALMTAAAAQPELTVVPLAAVPLAVPLVQKLTESLFERLLENAPLLVARNVP